MQHLQFKTVQLPQQCRIAVQKCQCLQIDDRTGTSILILLLQEQPFSGSRPVILFRQIQKQPRHPPSGPVIAIDLLHLFRHLPGILGISVDQCRQIQIICPQIPAGSFLFLQHIRCMIQDPACFIVSLFGNQKLCLKQSGRCIPFIHSHHTFHQFAGLCQPGTCSDLT